MENEYIGDNRIDDESEGNDTSSIIDFVAEPSYQGTIIDNQVLIEGKYFYKASVIQQVLNTSSSSVSKDRLRRVRGISKYADDKSADIEDMTLLGDPLIFTVGSSVKLGSVKDIQKGGKKLKYISGSTLQDENVIINLLELDLEDDGADMKWQGNHKDSFKIERKFCNSVQPEIKKQYIFSIKV